MLTEINPKLPMRDQAVTKSFYLDELGFEQLGTVDFKDYLMVRRDEIEIHFFAFRELDPAKNYGQVYIRTAAIDELYQSLVDRKISIHPAGALQTKAWGQKEFSLLDPDNNLLTFGQRIK